MPTIHALSDDMSLECFNYLDTHDLSIFSCVNVTYNSFIMNAYKSELAALLEINHSLSGWEFEAMSPSLKNNRPIVKAAIDKKEENLRYASEEVRNDKVFLFPLIKKSPTLLEFASEALRDDREFVSTFLLEHPNIFIYASSRLKRDIGWQQCLLLASVSVLSNTMMYSILRYTDTSLVELFALYITIGLSASIVLSKIYREEETHYSNKKLAIAVLGLTASTILAEPKISRLANGFFAAYAEDIDIDFGEELNNQLT